MIKKKAKNVLINSARSLGYDVIVKKNYDKLDENDMHFLHIGKNAGNQINHLTRQLDALSASGKTFLHGHDVFLMDIPASQKYFFSIRNPVSRFKSGFYSRKRKGQPMTYAEWTPDEVVAFETFEHANDLAEALFSGGNIGDAAAAAIQSIRHTAQSQSDWFHRTGNFLSVNPPVWIIRQESLYEDYCDFVLKSGRNVDPKQLKLATSVKKAHRFDYSNVPELSSKAVENLERWYVKDVELYRSCENWMNANA